MRPFVPTILLCLAWITSAEEPATGLPQGALQRLGDATWHIPATVNRLSLSPDGTKVACAGSDNVTRIIETATGRIIARMDARGRGRMTMEGMRDVAWSPDGGTVATAGSDGVCRLWEAATGLETKALGSQDSALTAVVFLKDGKKLVTAGNDGRLRVWDLAKGEEVKVLDAHAGTCTALKLSPSGDRLVSSGGDGKLNAWDTSSLEKTETWTHLNCERGPIAFSADGALLAVAETGGSLILRDGSSGKPLQFSGSNMRLANATAIAFSPDGKYLASVANDETVRIWNTADGASLKKVRAPEQDLRAVCFLADGKTLLAGTGKGELFRWSTSGWELANTEFHIPLRTAVLSPDGTKVVTTAERGWSRIWDAASGKSLLETAEGESFVHAAATWIGDGKEIAFACSDGTIIIRDAERLDMKRILVASGRPLRGIRVSPKGDRFAAIHERGPAVLIGAGESDKPLPVAGVEVARDTAFFPDGSMVAIVGDDVTLQVVGTSDGKPVFRGAGVPRALSVAWSPDGALVALGGGEAALWDAASWKKLRDLKDPLGPVFSIAFSPDGRWVAGGTEGTLRLWSVATGEPAASLAAHDGQIRWVQFSADSKRLVTASTDATALVWDLEALLPK
jgi:WD40 repeat protein